MYIGSLELRNSLEILYSNTLRYERTDIQVFFFLIGAGRIFRAEFFALTYKRDTNEFQLMILQLAQQATSFGSISNRSTRVPLALEGSQLHCVVSFSLSSCKIALVTPLIRIK